MSTSWTTDFKNRNGRCYEKFCWRKQAVCVPNPGWKEIVDGECYKDSSKARLLPKRLRKLSGVTPSQCRSACLKSNYAYSGVQYKKECWCGNTKPADENIATSGCNMPCKADKSKVCGGGLRMNVYSTRNSGVCECETCRCEAGLYFDRWRCIPIPVEGSGDDAADDEGGESEDGNVEQEDTFGSKNKTTTVMSTLSTSIRNTTTTMVAGNEQFSSKPSVPVGLLVGAAIGLVVIGLVVAILYFIVRRKTKRDIETSNQIEQEDVFMSATVPGAGGGGFGGDNIYEPATRRIAHAADDDNHYEPIQPIAPQRTSTGYMTPAAHGHTKQHVYESPHDADNEYLVFADDAVEPVGERTDSEYTELRLTGPIPEEEYAGANIINDEYTQFDDDEPQYEAI